MAAGICHSIRKCVVCRIVERDDGAFEWLFTPKANAQLVIREVYNDWSAQRGQVEIARTDTAGTAPPPLTRELIEKRWATAGKQLVQRVKTWLQFPEWFYLKLPVNTVTEPRRTPGGLDTQYSSVGHYELGDNEAMVAISAADGAYGTPTPALLAEGKDSSFQNKVHLTMEAKGFGGGKNDADSND